MWMYKYKALFLDAGHTGWLCGNEEDGSQIDDSGGLPHLAEFGQVRL